MTTPDNIPECALCGRPTRFRNVDGQYVCKQGCDQAAAEAATLAEAQRAPSGLSGRTAEPSPAPPTEPAPTLTGTVEEVLQTLKEHPELEEQSADV